jgi:hypothetical protein
MWLFEATKSINEVRRVRLHSAGEAAESPVFGGQEARAARSAGNMPPRGPGVPTGAGFPRKPSLARSCRVDFRACAEESSGNSANLV